MCPRHIDTSRLSAKQVSCKNVDDVTNNDRQEDEEDDLKKKITAKMFKNNTVPISDEGVGIEYSANHFVFSDGIERNPCNAGDNQINSQGRLAVPKRMNFRKSFKEFQS